MAHSVDAKMKAVQSTVCKPVLNRVLSKAKIEQLGSRSDTVLPTSQSRNRTISDLLIASLCESAYIAG